MGQSILVKMKRSGDLFSSHRRYVSKDDMFKLIKFFENMSDDEDRTYGSVAIDYSEDGSSGCRISSDLSRGQYESVGALLGVDDG